MGLNWLTIYPVENNPEILTYLAHRLGLSPGLKFQDIYSLTDMDLLSFIPRPAHALLFIYPTTPSSESAFEASQRSRPPYPSKAGSDGSSPTAPEPVLWFPQTIEHACGLYGLLHCTTSSATARPHILPSTPLAEIVSAAGPLSLAGRCHLLETSSVLESAHADAAGLGDTTPPALGEEPGHAFVAFVKAQDGHLWEIEGRGTAGPQDLGPLTDDEDVLSPVAVERGPMRHILREQEAGGTLRFSCTALVSA